MYYYVESPGQIVSAMEAVSFERDPSPKVFVRLNGSITNDTQIKNTLLFYQKKLSFNCVFINGIMDFLIKVVPIYILSKQKMFIGCHKSKFIKILTFFRLKLVFLDDGIASLIYMKDGGGNELFTCLNLKPRDYQKIVKHEFNFLNSLTEFNNIQSNYTIFFGAKYVESGLLDIDDYCNILKKIIEKNKHLVYVAHRAEDINNLNIYKALGLKVIRWDYPSEIELIKMTETPKEIIGLYSAALVSAKILLPSVNVISLYTDKFKHSQNNIDEAYNLISKYCHVESDRERL